MPKENGGEWQSKKSISFITHCSFLVEGKQRWRERIKIKGIY
jgi:hypothetical protein